MKRLLITFIILALVGGAVFLVGYTPLRVGRGSVAILYSRTSGWDPQPIVGGELRWEWEFLLPTNTSVIPFDVTTRSVSIRSEIPLPSADVYAPLLERTPDLTQRFSGTLRYRVTPSAFAELAPLGLDPAGLDEWYRDFDARLVTTALRVVDGAAETIADGRSIVVGELSDEIADRLADRHPEADIVSLVITELSLPDPALYALGRETYDTVQRARVEALSAQSAAAAVEGSERNRFIETLEAYGRILTEYPVLLEYLEIAARNGSDPLDIEAVRSLTGQGQ